MKIINFETIKEKVNKLDTMANVDMTKPHTNFPHKPDDNPTGGEKMQKFFEVADGENPSWNV